ncbi:MAG: protein kinase domain-containing protein [Betaproteobacteria bacterium]
MSALLDEVLALPPEARDGFVEALGGERAVHRDTLRALLAQSAAVETGDFLATLPRLTRVAAAPAGALTELSAGDSIGPYRLLSELGTGGMGAVWLAERSDGQLKRKVALKLPRLVWAKGLAERMARERDILATLEHPNIARLYDAGVDQHGRPYLALEYVEGQPIDVYARERGLSVRQKLDLLLQVCSAVAFAHSRLVVHRDLKPSNILVTADGQVRLLDFGIAKLMEGDSAKETQLTQLAGRALTLDYASPEQIKGEPIGTASDVYSLGVVAYELLTGAKPYKLKRGSAAELEEAIASADPPKASEAATAMIDRKALKGDLDSILSTALRKAVSERYATTHAFAEDLRRHVAGERVLARKDTALYVLRRLARRHGRSSAIAAAVVTAFVVGIGLGAAALAMLALGIGMAVAVWQAANAKRKAAEATANAARAEAVQQYLIGIFQANSAKQPDPQKARQTTARELLDIGRVTFREALLSQPAARAKVAALLSKLYSELGLAKEAADLARETVQLSEQVHGEGSKEYLRALSDLIYALSHVSGSLDERRLAGDRVLALVSGSHKLPSSERASALRAVGLSRYGDEAISHLKGAVESAEAVADHLEARKALELLGQRLNMAWRSEEAIRCLERALVHHRALRGGDDYDTLFLRVGLAECSFSVLRVNDACSMIDEACAIALRTGSPDGLDAMQTRWRRARILALCGRLDEAIAEFAEVLAVVEDPNRPDLFTASNAVGEMALALGLKGLEADALATHERSLRHADSARPDSPLACTARERLATTLLNYRDFDRASAVGSDIRERRRKLGSTPGHPDFDRALLVLARCELEAGRAEEAGTLLAQTYCLKPGIPPSIIALEAKGLQLDLASRLRDHGLVAALRNELDALLDVQRTRGMLPFAFMSLKLIEARYLFAQGRRDEAKACIDAASALLPLGLLPTAPPLGQLRSVEAL